MEFIQQNFGMIALCLVSGMFIVWPVVNKKLSNIREVDPLGAVQLMNHHDAVLIDVREDREMAEGRIPNARHIPLSQLANRLTELEKFKSRPIVVCCRSGGRSVTACVRLKKNGFGNVQSLSGGVQGWQQANLPITTKKS